MKKLLFLLIAIALSVSLSACGDSSVSSSAGSSNNSADESPVSAVQSDITPPAAETLGYSVIDTSEYARDGYKCILYRVEIGDSATEEDMRGAFKEITSGDSYYLHTVAFYGLSSDVEKVGSFTVGMLEEVDTTQRAKKYPTFTAPTIDAVTLECMREADSNGFIPAPNEIYSTPASENGYGDISMYAVGTLYEIKNVKGYDIAFFHTESGSFGVSQISSVGSLYDFDISSFDDLTPGGSYKVYFQYTGYSDVTETPLGSFYGAVISD